MPRARTIAADTPPSGAGPGNLVTPCVRMQRANESRPALSNAKHPLGVGTADGRADPHTPSQATEAKASCGSSISASTFFIGIPPLWSGSGKLGTPWVRMQSEYATNRLPAVVTAVVEEGPILAPDREPSPQPAASRGR